MDVVIFSKHFTGACYVSKSKGPNMESPRCATERVEAVTSLDILYNRFHEIIYAIMEASDGKNHAVLSMTAQMGNLVVKQGIRRIINSLAEFWDGFELQFTA